MNCENELVIYSREKYNPEPYIEGAFIFKYDNKYHLVQAIWSHRTSEGDTYIEKKGVTSPKTRYSYDCIISTAIMCMVPIANATMPSREEDTTTFSRIRMELVGYHVLQSAWGTGGGI